jgi:hypothetical protein
MTKGPIQPGRILENFQSLLHGGEDPADRVPSEETTPTFHGLATRSGYSKENPDQKRLTVNIQRPVSKIWRN